MRAFYASRIVLGWERVRVAADTDAAIEAAALECKAQVALLEAAGVDQALLAEVRRRVDAVIAASHAEAEEAAEVSEEAVARLAEMTAMTAWLREKVALARGLRAPLKAAVRRLWALRGVRPEATHVFMADSLRLAPYAPAFYEHLKEVRREEGRGIVQLKRLRSLPLFPPIVQRLLLRRCTGRSAMARCPLRRPTNSRCGA